MQYEHRQRVFDLQVEELMAEAESLRRVHPGCGVEKMYYALRPDFIGRDRFIALMMQAGFRLNKPRNYRRTTYAGKRHFTNLIKGLKIREPGQLWQSDITYILVGGQFFYAIFIIDVYSKVIVGYEVSRHMQATANVRALTMALKKYPAAQIHHSDRGSQYSSRQYLNLLEQQQTRISMGLKAQENAYAERINRTIKEEYLSYLSLTSFEHLKTKLALAVKHYNYKRPHNHLNKMTPIDFENRCKTDPTFDKPELIIFDDTKSLKPVNLG